jgi:hypothetical protein
MGVKGVCFENMDIFFQDTVIMWNFVSRIRILLPSKYTEFKNIVIDWTKLKKKN